MRTSRQEGARHSHDRAGVKPPLVAEVPAFSVVTPAEHVLRDQDFVDLVGAVTRCSCSATGCSNDADRELYERTKQELAQQPWKYVQNYADAKTSVVEEIIARATAACGTG